MNLKRNLRSLGKFCPFYITSRPIKALPNSLYSHLKQTPSRNSCNHLFLPFPSLSMSAASNMQGIPREDASPVQPFSTSPPSLNKKWPANLVKMAFLELREQRSIAVPLVVMNLMWFGKMAITTAFQGHLGELQLAGATLGFTFANVTGFSVLNGLSAAMEPICGQAYGAKNFKLLHKTLLMTILLLLLTSIPISFLWLNVEKILTCFGQQRDISAIAQNYLFFLLPDLVITSFLCPLRSYLSSQGITIPIMVSSGLD